MKKIVSLITLFLINFSINAQTDQISIVRAELACEKNGGQVLNVMLDKSVSAVELTLKNGCQSSKDSDACKKAVTGWLNEVHNADNYYVIKLSDATKFDLALIYNGIVLQNTLRFRLNTNLTLTDKTFKLISKITKLDDGSQKPNAAMIDIAIMDSCNSVAKDFPKPTELPKETTTEKKLSDYVKKPEDETSPVLKLKFSLDGSTRFKKLTDGQKKRKFFYIEADIRPLRIHHLGWGGAFNITPIFLKTEWGGTEKKDNLTIGTEFNHLKVFRDDGSPLANGTEPQKHFIGFNTIFTLKTETNWKFSEINLVHDFRERLPIDVYASGSTTIKVNPFLGHEIGYRFKSKDSKPGRTVNRGYVGADMYLGLFRKDDKHRFVIDAEYIRRMLIHRELSYDLDDSGKELPDRSSRRVREYFKTKFTLNLGVFSPYIQYEYGRLPTKFILINNHYTTGLDVNLDFMWKKNR
jgi:hypothetical protein